jgi:hypothetical protein
MTTTARPPRVSPSEHAAFLTEIKDLRRRADKLREARYEFMLPDRNPGKQRLDEWAAEAAACRARLNFWYSVLVIDRKIRAPIRLFRSCWRRVDTITALNEFKVQYFRYVFLGEANPSDLRGKYTTRHAA